MKTIRIATRQSPLALWQAEHVARLLHEMGVETQLVPLVSGGDTDMRPIDGTRQVGVFTKRIQQAVIDDEADIAVHSLKDLPTQGDESLSLAAVPIRETVADCLVSADSWTLDQLPEGARVGTGSRRRGAQLLHARPDLKVLPIRGNVQTRLKKLSDGEYDAIMLAEAGVVRLEMNDLPHTRLSLETMLPAPGQGALGIEVRANDPDTQQAVEPLNHLETRAAVTAERHLLADLEGGCLAPIAAYCRIEGDRMTLDSVVLSQDGKQRLAERAEKAFESDDWISESIQVATDVSEALRKRGAAELIGEHR